MPVIQNLIVNSAQRSSGSEAKFTINYSIPVVNPDAVALESVQLYHTQYTVNSNNYLLPFTTTNGSNINLSIPQGSYTSATLASAIESNMNAQALLNGDSTTYYCGFDHTSHKYSFSNTQNFSLLFSAGNSIAPTIGFNSTDKTSASNYSSDYVGHLNTKYYLIYADITTNNSVDANGSKSLIAYVPNNVNFGDIIDYKPHLSKSFKITKSDLSRINIEVHDDNDLLAQLNGVDWSMNLVVSLKS